MVILSASAWPRRASYSFGLEMPCSSSWEVASRKCAFTSVQNFLPAASVGTAFDFLDGLLSSFNALYHSLFKVFN